MTKMTKPTLYTAALSSALLLQFACCASATRHSPAFAFLSHHRVSQHSSVHSYASCSSLYSSAIDEIPPEVALDIEVEESSGGDDPESILQARNRLVALSTTLASNSPSGKFITRPSDKVKLQNAINDLEALASGPSDRDKEMMLGDWTLVATAQLPSSDIRRRFNNKNNDGEDSKKGGWFKNGKKKQRRSGLSLFGSEGKSLNPIQKSIRKTIEVTQRIRNDGTSVGDINRVDNVIEYTPLDTLESIIPEESPLFGLLGNVNVNPLQVKTSKVILIHKAEVESVKPVLRTKISWTSSVLNVAGTSQLFDPEGSDVFGLNNLFGEFLNAGTFDTPFVDEDIRISRTSGPVLEQLRVFIRKGSKLLDDDEGMMDSLTAELRVEEEKEVSTASSSDVGTQVKKVVEAVTSTAENARSTIEKDMDGVNQALSDTMNDVVAQVQDAVEDDLEQIGKAVQSVQSAIQDRDGENIGEALTNVTKAMAKVPTDVRSIVEEDATELGDKVEEALENLVADVQDSVESDLIEVQKSIEVMRDAATGGDSEKATELSGEVEEALDSMVVDFLDSAESAIQDRDVENTGGALTNVTKAVTKVPEDVSSIVEEDEFQEAVDSLVAEVQDSVESDLKDVQKSSEDVRDAGDSDKEDDANEK